MRKDQEWISAEEDAWINEKDQECIPREVHEEDQEYIAREDHEEDQDWTDEKESRTGQRVKSRNV